MATSDHDTPLSKLQSLIGKSRGEDEAKVDWLHTFVEQSLFDRLEKGIVSAIDEGN